MCKVLVICDDLGLFLFTLILRKECGGIGAYCISHTSIKVYLIARGDKDPQHVLWDQTAIAGCAKAKELACLFLIYGVMTIRASGRDVDLGGAGRLGSDPRATLRAPRCFLDLGKSWNDRPRSSLGVGNRDGLAAVASV